MRFQTIREFVESNATMGSLLAGNEWNTYIKRKYGLYDVIFESEAITPEYSGTDFYAVTFHMAGKQEIIFGENAICNFINQNLFKILLDKTDLLWDENYRCYDDAWDALLPPHALRSIRDELETRSEYANKILFNAAKMAKAPLEIAFSESVRRDLNIGVKYKSYGTKKRDSMDLMHLLLPALLEPDPYQQESNETAFLREVAVKDAGGTSAAYFLMRMYAEALRMAKAHCLPSQDFGEEAYRKARTVLVEYMKSDSASGNLSIICKIGDNGFIPVTADDIDKVLSGYGIRAPQTTRTYPWDQISVVKMGNKIIWRK